MTYDGRMILVTTQTLVTTQILVTTQTLVTSRVIEGGKIDVTGSVSGEGVTEDLGSGPDQCSQMGVTCGGTLTTRCVYNSTYDGAVDDGANETQSVTFLLNGLVRRTIMRQKTDVTVIVERTTLTVTSRVRRSLDVIPRSTPVCAHPRAHARRSTVRMRHSRTIRTMTIRTMTIRR